MTTKVEGGTVKINSKSTTLSDDKTYFYTTSATEPLGIVFGSQIFWEATGSAADGVPVISDNDGSGFPNFPVLSEFQSLDQTQNKLMNWSNSNGRTKRDSKLNFPKWRTGYVKARRLSLELLPTWTGNGRIADDWSSMPLHLGNSCVSSIASSVGP